MGLLPKGQLRPVAGRILLQGEDLLAAGEKRLRDLRCTRMSMIFQEPMTALNPVMSCGDQIDEVLRTHTRLDAGSPAASASATVMAEVHLPDPGAADPRLSASALGRPAPAHHDRHGADPRAGAADRRRADHRARRHHPGADPASDQGAAARTRDRRPVHHPRLRRGRRDRRAGRGHALRSGGRAGRGEAGALAPAARLHSHADRRGAEPRAPPAGARGANRYRPAHRGAHQGLSWRLAPEDAARCARSIGSRSRSGAARPLASSANPARASRRRPLHRPADRPDRRRDLPGRAADRPSRSRAGCAPIGGASRSSSRIPTARSIRAARSAPRSSRGR